MNRIWKQHIELNECSKCNKRIECNKYNKCSECKECNECNERRKWNECKRKVVNNIAAEQSCKLKHIHWRWKKLWRIKLGGDGVTWRSCKDREWNKEGIACVELETNEDPSQQLAWSRHGEQCCWSHARDSVACMSSCARMQSNPFSTLTKAKTRSKSNWRWTCTSASWCAWPPTHTWISAWTLCISVLPVPSHPRRSCAC